MLTCLVLTTDTIHHRYFVNRLLTRARVVVVLEQRTVDRWRLYRRTVLRRRSPWALIDNPYLIRSYSRFEARQDAFERAVFGREVPLGLEDVEMRTFEDVNDHACVELARGIRPDLLVSFGTGLIGGGLLTLPGLKVNIHRGILPVYRGLDSDLWASYFSDFERIGTTVHELDDRFDTGGVIGEARLEPTARMRAHELRCHTTMLAAGLVEGILERLATGMAVVAAEQPDGGSYYSFIPPAKRYLAIRRFEAYTGTLPT